MFKENRIERMLMSYTQDGLFDIVFGLMILFAVVSLRFEIAAFNGVMIVLLLLIMRSLKHQITAPRIGAADFPPDIEQKIQRAYILLCGMTTLLLIGGMVTFIATTRTLLPAWLINAGLLIGGIFALSLATLLAFVYLNRNRRLTAYGGMALLLLLLARWLDFSLALGMMGLATIMLVVGLWVLYRFVQTHPPLPPELRLRLEIGD